MEGKMEGGIASVSMKKSEISVEKKENGLFNNLVWKFAERFSAQIVTTVVSIILARLLEPSHYGIISIVTIFITIANVFVSDGFGSALIQKKNADRLDFSSVLIFNICFSLVLYAVLFFIAPVIADFYGEGYEILVPVLRVLGLRLIFSAVNSVQQAYVSKQMIFQKFFWATLFGTVLSAIVGILMAYKGFGVWALVAQYMTNTTVDTVVLAFSLRKKPSFGFSFCRIKGLIGYGSKILGTSLIISTFDELRALIIGKVYSSTDLAYFDKGKQFPGLIVNNINSSIGAVLFPKMAKEQNDIVRIKETARMSIRFSSYFMFPLMLGFAAVAKPFVRLFLTEKWIDVVPYLQIFCVFYLFQPIHSANMQAIKAVGRGDIYLKNEIVKKVIEIITLVIAVSISAKAIAIGMAICATAFIVINAYPNRKLINYSLKEQIKDISPAMILAMIMCASVWALGFVRIPIFPLMCIQIIAGATIYIVLSAITKNHEFIYVCSFIKEKFKRTR
ncbi:MAG: lipopolysaccharide biosynthesis protein [Ruminococcus flavefaciens]|nr:lipopolysaccharide biosynthesis protein [Ruminococcus flavefaciens]